MPAGLSEGAVAEWGRMVKVLGNTPSLLTKADGWALAELCKSADRVAVLYEWMKANESVDRGTTGQPIQHPKVKEYQWVCGHLKALLAEFGLTPSSRSRVAVSEPKRKSDKGRFFGT